jgi:hypothetical protein
MEYRWLYSVPSSTAIKEIIPGNEQLLVYFYPPILDGGTPITGYEYSLNDSSFIFVRNTVSPMIIRGLTNGTTYQVVIRAVNIVGHGPPSEPVDGTPVTVPSAPIITGITPGDQHLTVVFDTPSDGGSHIIDYQYSVNNGSSFTSAGTTDSPITITDLSNGTTYQIVIRAVNAVGNGYPSTAVMGTPVTIPSEPTITVVPGNEQLTVYVTPPFNGGSPIIDYQYSISTTEPLQWVSVGLINPFIITNLTNGTLYTVQLKAVNRIGEGFPSTPVDAIPATVPGTPTNISITPGNGELLVTFTRPSDGGSTITGYQYSIGGSFLSAQVDAEVDPSFTIMGLTNGQLYQVVIRAVNIIGAGVPSNMEPGTPATTPSAPRITRVIPGDKQLTVYFAPPFNGGSPIIGYQYSTDNGTNFSLIVEPVNNVIIIAELTNGTVYQVIIRAVNEVGDGANSNMVTKYPVTVPSAPTIDRIASSTDELGNFILVMFITPPDSDGGSVITDYQYSIGDSFISLGLPELITEGLPTSQYVLMINGVPIDATYTFVLRASNSIGNGALSPDVIQDIYITIPDPPTIIEIEAGNQELIVDFEPPFITGGSPIVYYQYSIDNGKNYINVRVIDSPPFITITGLINDKTYDVIIKAVNSKYGPGEPSNMVQGTPKNLPSAPRITGITPGDNQLKVFIIPSSIGEPIDYYQYSLNGGTTFSLPYSLDLPDNSITITGLDNGTSYPIVVRAVNAIGVGPNSNTVTGTPGILPDAPTFTVASGNGQLTVTITSSTQNITGYQCTATPTTGSPVIKTGTSPIVITGLTNGTTYSVVVRAINSSGTGPDSAPVSGTPGTVPDAPSLFGIVSGNGQLSVGFCPVPDGGSPITGYEYTATPTTGSSVSGQSETTTSPVVIPGLTNGTTYSVVLRAINQTGPGSNSNSLSGIPGIPSAPRISGITAGNEQLSVAFVPPASTGGFPITGYECTVTLVPPVEGWYIIQSVTTSPFLITGLTNGISYSVVIHAINQTGPGPNSTAVSGTPGTTPSAPMITGITPGIGQLSVAFTAPTSTGGFAITSYQYSLNGSDGTFIPINTTVSPILITGLTNSTTYQVSILAVNQKGNGTPSHAVSATTNTVPPSAPTITLITPGPGIGQLSIAFNPPTSDGGFAITGYEYTATPVPPTTGSPVNGSTGPTSIIITGLSNATYQVQIRAVNQKGTGAISNMLEGTPVTVPLAPTITGITSGVKQLEVNFTPPSTGGAPILYYEYSLDNPPPSNWVNAGTGNPIYITGLSDGTSYSVTIRAVNVYGNGDSSATVPATTTVLPPSAPTITGINSDLSDNLLVYFTPPSYGEPFTGYKYSTNNGSTFTLGVHTSTMIIVPSSPNVTNQVIIRAVNTSGDGAISNMVEAISGAPPAPTITAIDPHSEYLIVHYTESIHSKNITSHQYSKDGAAGPFYDVELQNPIFIGSLMNGTSYSVVIRSSSNGVFGALSNTVIGIPGAPSAPTIISVAPGNGQLTVTFTAPLYDGGFSIETYAYTYNRGLSFEYLTAPFSEPLHIIITGLTNGQSYPVIIRAANGLAIFGPDSNTVNGTPSTTPSAPSITSIIPGNKQLFVYFTPPLSDGDSPITDYLYTLTPSGGSPIIQSGGTTTSPIVITGLTNGTYNQYQVFIQAVNIHGESAPSNTKFGTPGVPTAPTNIAITPGNGILSVAFTPPSSDGGFLITGYKCQAEQPSPGPGIFQSGGTTSPFVMTGLTNGTNYTNIRIAAFNSIGDGIYSYPPVSGTPIGPPSAPTNISITPGNGQLSVAFTAPSYGNPSSYQCTATPATGPSIIQSGTASPIDIIGLTNGTSYSVIVQAVNSFGPGTPSTAVNEIPFSVPSAPYITGITPGNQQLSVAFCPPITNGGFSITSYQCTATPATGSPVIKTGTASPILITGLTNNATYDVIMYAISSKGNGDYSNMVVGTPGV